MSHFDDQLPEDIREIAARLGEARATFSPLELDRLRERLARRAVRSSRGFLPGLRMRSVAGLLTAGLMLSSGAGVVIASSALGGGSHTFDGTRLRSERDASECEYHHRHSVRHEVIVLRHHRVLTVVVTFDCSDFIVHVVWPGNSFQVQIDSGPTQSAFSQFTGIAALNANSVTVFAGGKTFTFSLNF